MVLKWVLFHSDQTEPPDGSRPSPIPLGESIYGPITAAAGLAGVRFHDLRHFFASMLIAQGESAKYVCDQLGHSSIKVTFDTYGHLFPQAKQEASSKLEEAMFAARKEPSVENLVEKLPKQSHGKRDGRRAN